MVLAKKMFQGIFVNNPLSMHLYPQVISKLKCTSRSSAKLSVSVSSYARAKRQGIHCIREQISQPLRANTRKLLIRNSINCK